MYKFDLRGQRIRMFHRQDRRAPDEIPAQSSLTRNSLLLVCFLTIPVANTIHAIAKQQEPSGSFAQPLYGREPIAHEIDLRTVYVAVTEQTGNPISDLNREDFTVRENGVPQEILEVSPASPTPLLIGVMVDASGSTAEDESRHESLQAFSKFFANTLRDSDEAFVVAFGMSTLRLTGITHNFPELQAGLKEIDETHPVGGTALYDCLYTVAETMSQDQTRRKIIVVFSDFEDNSSRRTLEKTISHLQEMETWIFPLVKVDRKSRQSRRVKQAVRAGNLAARESGGVAYVSESPREQETALSHIQLVLRNSYALKYRATGTAKKGKSVAVKIEVQRKNAQIIAAEGRTATLP